MLQYALPLVGCSSNSFITCGGCCRRKAFGFTRKSEITHSAHITDSMGQRPKALYESEPRLERALEPHHLFQLKALQGKSVQLIEGSSPHAAANDLRAPHYRSESGPVFGSFLGLIPSHSLHLSLVSCLHELLLSLGSPPRSHISWLSTRIILDLLPAPP